MPAVSGNKTPTLRDALLSAYMLCSERVRVGKQNEERFEKLNSELATVKSELSNMTACFNHATRLYKNIEEHERMRKEEALSILNGGIAEVARIVPDANMRGMHLQISESNKVRIINSYGQDINKREGGGARTMLGVLLRYTCVTENQDAIPMMLFDESFFTLSDTTTMEARKTLESLSKKTLVIFVEQRSNLLADISDVEFQFVKDDNGITSVKSIDLRGGKSDY